MKKTLLILTVLIYTLAGCKLDEAGFKQNSVGATSLLYNQWFIKAVVSFTPSLPQLGTTVETNLTAKDYYIFNTDNTFAYSSSNPDYYFNGTYTYDAGSKTLSFGPDIEDQFKVTKLTTDSLIMVGTASATANNTTTYTTITYKLALK
jgi:hypothetical protein